MHPLWVPPPPTPPPFRILLPEQVLLPAEAPVLLDGLAVDFQQ